MKWIKRKISDIKYKYRYLKILDSPFKPFGLKWYAGKITMGTPYFLPRKWVDSKDKPGYKTAIPITRFGFNSVSLGWKTKWEDFRFEWAPMISLVIFNRQVCVWANYPEQDHYWECWLEYEMNTDKTKSRVERIAEARNNNSQVWTRHSNDGKVTIDYWDVVLKEKYRDVKEN